jgi:regulatory protein
MLPTQTKVKKPKSAQQALSSLMRLCARAERSSGDAKRLMATWGVAEGERAAVLQRLIKERFIDDERYAEAFVREKSRLSGWGEYKIRTALGRKGIATHIIEKALQQLSPEQNRERLTARLSRKIKTVKHSSPYDLKNKLLRYGLSLGFTMDDVIPCVEQFMRERKIEECDDFLY